MKKYKVSILIPIYKASNFIEKCAESVFSQTLEGIEYIFVNDATPDDSIEKLQKIITRFPNRKNDILIFHNTINKGISDSRQIAFDHARGEFFLAMDSDDWIERNMIELLYKEAITRGSDIVLCPYFRSFLNKEYVETPFLTNDKKQLIENALNGNCAYWNKLISLDLLRRNKIRTLSGVNLADDLVVLVKLLYYANSISHINTPLYHYVQFNENACTRSIPAKHIPDHINVTEDIEQFFSEKSDFYIYKKMLFEFKAKRKIKIIRASSAKKTYLPLYPELNQRTVWRMNLPLKSKIILSLARNRQENLLKIFLKILKFLNKLIR